MTQANETMQAVRTLGFVKEHNIWYADLPEYLENGLGIKANLMMVDGADTFLDYLSKNGTKATLLISQHPFDNYDAVLSREFRGLNRALLDEIGHAPVDYGAYYQVTTYKGQPFAHRLWLCPVTEYVFNGFYPRNIYIKLESAQ